MTREEQIRTAVRILDCYVDRVHPDPQNVEALRAIMPAPVNTWEADELASYVINIALGIEKFRAAP